MERALSHRGPDAGDVWQDPDVGMILAHRRLAIIDLSAEGAQPMSSSSGRYVITYNGEMYNYLALQKELKQFDIVFRGRSDTEIILAAIEHWGLNIALQKFNGMFAFALWDRKDKKLHLARDRFGKKPLYVGWAGKNFVFASELKALRAHPDFKPVLNQKTLASYLHYACVPAPACIYENVWSLKPAHRLMIDTATMKHGEDLSAGMETYWNTATVIEEQHSRKNILSDAAATAELENVLEECVRDRMMSDVPLGAFLSGGIDSSAVVALMQKNSPRKVKTYTIGFEEGGYNEASHAAAIAQHLGTEHHEHIMRPADVLNVVPKLPDIYDEPFADISAIPTFLVSQFAREDITVALSGDGGDEMFGGYNRHFIAPKLWRRMMFVPSPARHAMAQAMRSVPVRRWDALKPEHPQFGERMYKIATIIGASNPQDMYDRLVAQWIKPPLATHQQGFARDLDTPRGLSFAEKMMYWDTASYLPDDILVKVDRASMAVGLEARAPLLDRRIFEFAWRLPQEMKIRDGKGKWILRQMLSRHVPDALFERPKQGFAMPVGAWLRGELRDWAENLLDENKLKVDGVLDAPAIRKAWQQHLNGQGQHAQKLWTVLMFQSWKEKWL